MQVNMQVSSKVSMPVSMQINTLNLIKKSVLGLKQFDV